ncbi:MAG: hypothetical protein DDT25_01091 [Chloroflexi bacterium]|nr:hypothetical protein [Chloroflexota bacterium]
MPAEDAAVTLLEFAAQINDLYLRQPLESGFADPRRQFEQVVTAGMSSMVAGDVRGSASEDYHRTGKLSQFQRYITGVIERALVMLLIGPLVFLVDYDEPQVGLRGKDSASRTDDHIAFAIPNSIPLIELFPWGKLTVEDGHSSREARGKAGDGLRRQGNLRNQNDGLLTMDDGLLQSSEVYLCLAAAGNTVQQKNPRIPVDSPTADCRLPTAD